MPWLIKGKEKPSDNLLFVHIPRCGGTSLMKSNNVPDKAIEGAPFYKRFGMKTFFTRYELLEKNNFPIWTEVNAACLFIFIIGCFLLQIRDMEYKALSITMIAGSSIVSSMMTYVFVAPTICRIRFVRRMYLIFVQYILCQIMSNIDYITGTNFHGYLPHLTANKMISYGYVSTEKMNEVSSLAIVRNPYARMFSIYMYNRFGPWESFSHFVKSWYNGPFKDYRESDCEMEEWYTPCHAIPQFEYTHVTEHNNTNNGTSSTKQLIQSVVKQEELKYLKKISHNSNPATKNGNDAATGRTTDHNSSPSSPSSPSSSGGGITLKMEDYDDDDDENNEAENKNNNGNSDDDEKDDTNSSICSRSTSSSTSSSEEFSTPNNNRGSLTNLDDDRFTSTIRSLPDTIRDALLNMPHDNKRKTKTLWYMHYDQETLNLTYEMYHKDFDIFNYNKVLEQRPDLDIPSSIKDNDGDDDDVSSV
ncbi:MAG: hypothetical protein ACI8RD_005756 [Bacillariaceae sp.]|jgi:hypothetical protein